MKIKLSEHFTYAKLIQFTLPSMLMTVFVSIYGVVDGFFISNYVGKSAFAAVNLILPLPFLLATIGFMFGAGGSAIVAHELGRKHTEHARQIFTMLFITLVILGIIMTFIGEMILPWSIHAFGSTEELYPMCLTYGRILITGTVPFMLQNFFQALFVTAGKPNYGLFCTVLAGVTNMVLDYVLVGILQAGIPGAAYATLFSYIVGATLPLLYFSHQNKSLLRFVKPVIESDKLLHTCTNGASELLTNISLNLVNILYNFQLMKYIGEDGVSSYGVVMYVYWIFAAVYIGYSIGSAPIVSYHHGAKNTKEVKNLFQKSLLFLSCMAILLTILSLSSASFLAKIYVGYDATLFMLTKHAFRIFSLSFLVMGINIYASSFFTALGNGGVSAFISVCRTLIFQVIAVMLLPLLFGVEGIWWAVCMAEGCALIVSIVCFLKYKDIYHYA